MEKANGKLTIDEAISLLPDKKIVECLITMKMVGGGEAFMTLPWKHEHIITAMEQWKDILFISQDDKAKIFADLPIFVQGKYGIVIRQSEGYMYVETNGEKMLKMTLERFKESFDEQ